jgi:tRNA-splicing ligase RtcB (3'-phosphate/5'-hydroxy nucleic acid ligase)
MKKRELRNLGFDTTQLQLSAQQCIDSAKTGNLAPTIIRSQLQQLAKNPEKYLEDEHFSALAKRLTSFNLLEKVTLLPVGTVALHSWLNGEGDSEAYNQIVNASRLPIARAAALMPDAHLGYGLPIGGVLATENAVIPYAVGVDIACRVKVTVLDIPVLKLGQNQALFERALNEQTIFGMGGGWNIRQNHPVLDLPWNETKLLNSLKDKAWRQLGTSGSGNHFVEFGELRVLKNNTNLASHCIGSHTLEPGVYLALVSHSGSRGSGAQIATHYSNLATSLHPALPGSFKNLAWLDLNTEAGQEYWLSMNLMGEYASANHEVIHKNVLRAVGARPIAVFENHHNFAWKENHHGKELVVHRKGATPAAKGEIGYIPGTMADPGYLVEGLGNPKSLNSSAHGAGRRLSRTKAKHSTTRNALNSLLKERKVTTLSCGLDESPHAYKNINEVMAAQSDLVHVLGRFVPRVVKMAPEGEKPED